MPDLLDLFTATTAVVGEIVAVDTDPYAATPCPGWNQAQLFNHLVGGDRMFCKILSGTAPGGPPPGGRVVPDPDQPPPTLDDYLSASDELARLLADPTIRAAVHQAPVGPVPGDGVIVLRSTEHFLHGWDLARSSGASTTGLEPVAGALTGPALRLLERVSQAVTARRPFGDPVAMGTDASAVAKLVAAFGRDPEWAPDPIEEYGRLKDRFAGYPDVELPDGTRRGFGAEGMRVGDAIFATPHQDRLMIKLPEQEVTELIESRVGLPVIKTGARPMREWVVVPFDGAAPARAERAYAFVSGLS